MTRLEKLLGLRDLDDKKEENDNKQKKDPERMLKAYMSSWEGVKNEQLFNHGGMGDGNYPYG